MATADRTPRVAAALPPTAPPTRFRRRDALRLELLSKRGQFVALLRSAIVNMYCLVLLNLLAMVVRLGQTNATLNEHMQYAREL